MSRNEPEDDRDEYADWELPGQSGADERSEEDQDGELIPPEMREPLLRDRIRARLGVTPRQWYVVESILLALPYLVFVYVYLAFDVNETFFLAVTLAYSLVATYVGFLS